MFRNKWTTETNPSRPSAMTAKHSADHLSSNLMISIREEEELYNTSWPFKKSFPVWAYGNDKFDPLSTFTWFHIWRENPFFFLVPRVTVMGFNKWTCYTRESQPRGRCCCCREGCFFNQCCSFLFYGCQSRSRQKRLTSRSHYHLALTRKPC